MRRFLEGAREAGLSVAEIQKQMQANSSDVSTPVSQVQPTGRCCRCLLLSHSHTHMHCLAPQADFMAALKKVQRSVGPQDLKKFREWRDTYGSQ